MKIAVLLGAALILLGCGEDDKSNPPVVSTIPDVGTMDVSVPDVDADTDATSDADAGVPGECGTLGFCEGSTKCVKDDCVPLDAKLACDEVTDLGTLDITQSKNFSGDTTGFADTLNSSCGEGTTFTGPENAFRFEVSAPATVTVNLTTMAGVNWLMELKRGACDVGAEIQTCSDSETFSFNASVGTVYYLIVEPAVGLDVGAFDIDLSFAPLVCVPGETTCDADNVVTCFGGTSEIPYGCADSCTDTSCDGETCAQAIEVTASTTFGGDIKAYSSTFNFAGIASCSTNGNGTATQGQDIILSLPNLTAGQVVVVDASMDTQDDVIAVLPTCDPTPTCERFVDLGDLLTWTVATSGNYFIVVDRPRNESGAFAFSVDIQ